MKVLLIGSNGKMGMSMQKYMRQNNIEYFGIDKDDAKISLPKDVDVAIDFSNASALEKNLAIACKNNLPIIIATTGHQKNAYQKILQASSSIPILVAPNLSFQFLAFNNMVSSLACARQDAVVIKEVHNKNKQDVPSGSAKLILNKLAEQNIKAEVISVRVGDVVCEHEISVYGEHETLTITHKAHSREVFCQGAIKAAKLLKNRPAGLYNLEGLINDSK